MDKKEEFKEFAKNNPHLIEYVKSGEMTWQKFYEIYDIYGEDNNIWDKYKKEENNEEQIGGISSLMKGIDLDKIQEHIKTAEKALGFISELTKKDVTPDIKIPETPRPITNFFKD